MKRSCSPHQSAGSDGLSLLARGRGLIDGGVEIECFSQECRDLSVRFLSFFHAYLPIAFDLENTHASQNLQYVCLIMSWGGMSSALSNACVSITPFLSKLSNHMRQL